MIKISLDRCTIFGEKVTHNDSEYFFNYHAVEVPGKSWQVARLLKARVIISTESQGIRPCETDPLTNDYSLAPFMKYKG